MGARIVMIGLWGGNRHVIGQKRPPGGGRVLEESNHVLGN